MQPTPEDIRVHPRNQRHPLPPSPHPSHSAASFRPPARSHMRCITKEKTALFIPNAIAIITSKKEYIFRSFWDREDAFKTLKQCQQDSNSAAHSAHSASAPAVLADGPLPSRDDSLNLGGSSRYIDASVCRKVFMYACVHVCVPALLFDRR